MLEAAIIINYPFNTSMIGNGNGFSHFLTSVGQFLAFAMVKRMMYSYYQISGQEEIRSRRR